MNCRFAVFTDTPTLDAQVLLAHVINRSRTWLLAHPEYVLSSSELETSNNAITAYENGTPLPYLIGSWEFFGRKFFITPDVLIPRPETELLVEMALRWVDNRLIAHPGEKIIAADIGCGCGCIGISLGINRPAVEIIACDISLAAISVAIRNAISHSVRSRFHPIQCDLIPPVISKFHLICANLPYIPSQRLTQLAVFKKEPTLALDGGRDGMDVLKRLLSMSPWYLATGGMMLLEIDSSQGECVEKLAKATFPGAMVELFQDLAGHDRLISIQQGN